MRIFGCLQETTDGFILGDGCNQLKSAFTGLPEARTVHTSVLNCRREKVRCFALLEYTTARQSLRLLYGFKRFSPAHALKLLYFTHAKALAFLVPTWKICRQLCA